jgi:hypothetical protein
MANPRLHLERPCSETMFVRGSEARRSLEGEDREE